MHTVFVKITILAQIIVKNKDILNKYEIEY